MVALQWETADGKDVKINDIFSSEGLVAGATINAADQIQVWNGTSFDTYF